MKIDLLSFEFFLSRFSVFFVYAHVNPTGINANLKVLFFYATLTYLWCLKNPLIRIFLYYRVRSAKMKTLKFLLTWLIVWKNDVKCKCRISSVFKMKRVFFWQFWDFKISFWCFQIKVKKNSHPKNTWKT
jgi:hypothetical protein